MAQAAPQIETFDAIIIGSGQGGNPLAGALAGAGKKTALVERRQVGGTCINTGCTPTKTMVASARVAYLAGRGKDYGVETGPLTIHLEKVRERKRAIVTSFREGSEKRLSKAGVELIRGTASFTGSHDLDVTSDASARRLTAGLIFIDTGAHSVLPKIAGIEDIPCLDNESIMELDRVPEHLVVLGGGYIALEFGQMFRRFGSRVTVLESSPRLLHGEDPDVSAEVLRILEEDGMRVLLDAHTDKIARSANGVVTLRGHCSSGAFTVEGSDVLVAAGRAPNTADLHLERAGIACDSHGYVIANERLETAVPGVYAIGDVKGGPQFTHIAYDDYRILKANLLDGGYRTTGDRMVPYTMFIDPQLGRIGMSETEARKSGRKIRVARMPMTSVARALEVDETRGFMKAIVDAETEEILGATVLGLEGGEVMAVFETAMLGHLKFTALRDAVFAHPTLAESINNLFFHFDDEK